LTTTHFSKGIYPLVTPQSNSVLNDLGETL
jgi:hypothetical protein